MSDLQRSDGAGDGEAPPGRGAVREYVRACELRQHQHQQQQQQGPLQVRLAAGLGSSPVTRKRVLTLDGYSYVIGESAAKGEEKSCSAVLSSIEFVQNPRLFEKLLANKSELFARLVRGLRQRRSNE